MFVFPGFLSMPVSVAFSDQLTVFLLFAISLFLTVQAIKSRKFFWLWMPISVVLGVAQMFLIEYFVLLEVIRPLIIWFTLRSQQVEQKTGAQENNPLLAAFCAWDSLLFLGWRLFYIPKALGSDPNSVDLVKTILSSPIIGLNTIDRDGYPGYCAFIDIHLGGDFVLRQVQYPWFENWHDQLVSGNCCCSPCWPLSSQIKP